MKNLINLLIAFNLILPTLADDSCLELEGLPIVSWVAFKTPQKIGVKGQFNSVEKTGKNKASSLEDLLLNQSVVLKPEDISTNNPARDKKIKDYFFGKMEASKVLATIKNVSKKAISIELILNGRKKLVPLAYELKNQTLKANGHIDVLDFSLLDALSAINKACFALHEGKTWSHVEINLEQKFKSCL